MEYIGLLVIITIITLLWFVNYQNHSLTALALHQNQKIDRLTKQFDELSYALQVAAMHPNRTPLIAASASIK